MPDLDQRGGAVGLRQVFHVRRDEGRQHAGGMRKLGVEEFGRLGAAFAVAEIRRHRRHAAHHHDQRGEQQAARRPHVGTVSV